MDRLEKVKETRSAGGTNRLAIALAIFLTALAARLFYMWQISDSPAFITPIIDSSTYREIALRLSDEGIFDPRLMWQGVFYPLFLAAVYSISNNSDTVARIVQAVVGSSTAVMVYLTGRRIFDIKTGMIAGLIAALYGPSIFFETELLATGWASFAAILLVYLFISAEDERSPWFYLILGVTGGFSAMIRATLLPFFLLASIFSGYSLVRNEGRSRSVLKLSCVAGGFLVMMLLVSVLSQKITGYFSPVPRSGTINLYIGNNPDRDRTMMIRPGYEWREFVKEPERHGYRDDAGHRAYFMKLFREYVVMQPGSYLKGLGAKSVQFFSSRELPRNVDIYINRKYSGFLSVAVWKFWKFGFPFGILLPFAVAGIILRFRRLPVSLWLFFLSYPFTIILVFVSARYRTVMIPALSIPAAAGAVALASREVWSDKRRIAVALSGFLAFALLSVLPGPFVMEKYNYEAEMHASVGFELVKNGDVDRAEEEFNKALSSEPGYIAGHRMLGNLLSQKGEYGRAEQHFRRVLESDPDSYAVNYYMGLALIRLGRQEEAAFHLRKAEKGARKAGETRLCDQIKRMLSTIE